ncbi:MAG: MJ0042-type zinc finger domain-containing protein [Rickettsia endosymbiont of Pentastiridius leporinus]
MYIACPNCQTKFIVSNNQIGINGRRVKCSKCSHIWYQKFDYKTSKLSDFENKISSEPIKTPIKNEYSNQSFNVSVILPYVPPKPKKNNLFALVWSCFIILCLAILFIDGFGFLNKYDQLKMEEIHIGKSYGGTKILYKLSNHSDYLISKPLIKVRVMDRNKHVLEDCVSIIKLHTKIPAKQSVYVEMDMKNLPPTASYIDVTIGNRLGFLLDME